MIYSVIIPAFNAQDTLRGCLESCLNQSIEKSGYEIIVVDDGSTDATADTVKEYSGVKLLSGSNKGPAAARNRGVAEASGDVVLFTDADCKPSPDWVKEMVKPFSSDTEIVGVKGCYRTDQKEIIARFVQLEYEDKYDRMKREKFIDFIDTYSAAFRRDVFLNMGGYDVNFPVACAEDVDFSYRLATKGYKMVFNPNAVVFHHHPDTLSNYLKKKFKFAYWRMLALKKNPNKVLKDSHTPQLMKLQVFLIPLIILFGLFSFFVKLNLVLFISCFILYIISIIPFVVKAIRKDAVVGLLSLLLLSLRGIAQFFGLIYGMRNILKKRCNKDAEKI